MSTSTPAPHQPAGNVKVQDGGNCHRCRLYFAVGREHLLNRSKGFAVKLAGGCVRAGGIGIHHSHKPHATRLLELAVNADMVASKGTRPDDCNIDG